MQFDQLGQALVATLAFAVVGLLVFLIAFGVIVKVTPFSIRKEIEEDHNVSLAILIAAVIIGISLVIAAAIHG
jgi:uncharacterized membrane protein YjfL (UPF0719 family)